MAEERPWNRRCNQVRSSADLLFVGSDVSVIITRIKIYFSTNAPYLNYILFHCHQYIYSNIIFYYFLNYSQF